jgi:hypothetical protein
MEAGERIELLEEWKRVHVSRHIELEEKVERLLAELAEIRQTSGRIKELIDTPVGSTSRQEAEALAKKIQMLQSKRPDKEIKIKDSGRGKDK